MTLKIGTIDYSRPEFKTMFANYGLTAMAAISLEKTILLLIAAIDSIGKGYQSEKDLHANLQKHIKKTLGQLVEELKKRIIISSELEDVLKQARQHRNKTIHHFFFINYDTLILPNGPTLLSDKLKPIRDLFAEIQNKIDQILELISKELSKPLNEISPEVKKLLKHQKNR
jgi:hypothetical protein